MIEVDDSLKVCLVTILLATAISVHNVGLVKLVSAVIGRLQVKRLISQQQPISSDADSDNKDASVSGIFVYPVKSLRAVSLDEARIDDNGIVGDRRFMLVMPRPVPLLGSFRPGEPTFQFVTQRQVPKLATIVATLSADCLTLSSSDDGQKKVSVQLNIDEKERPSYKARIWDDVTTVTDMGDDAANFVAGVVAKDSDAPPNAANVRLVSMSAENRRETDDKYTPNAALSWTGAAPKVGLTDGFPILIANTASLEELNRRLAKKGKEPIPMSRFRPNIVVSGAKPFEEDTWKVISIGDGVLLHIVKGCPRCKQSCTDQQTGKVSEEPLETLAEFRALGPVKENVYFAQNAIAHTVRGTLSVGAKVHVLERGEPTWDSS
ncbi:amidoxime reducing component [Seminavis robusta]|uniref:Amidoxime reducing component n=1 Tax=Seminavis robusta TaxID=568900 RepID=A0A9N8H751_9STRA|nr:amidoxime reducing component [Seminavis robusta]|eukprot:Sro191_g082380.1 amidoxime reducing component (378) ;mRNA; f:85372-86631